MARSLRKTMAYLGLSDGTPETQEYDKGIEYNAVAPEPARTLAAVPQPEEVELTRIATVHPSTYNEAREIGEAFRDGIPVILNLTELSEAEAKRMVDFSAGLVFGLHGAIERVTSKVFLLSPASVLVSTPVREDDSEQRRFFNQA